VPRIIFLQRALALPGARERVIVDAEATPAIRQAEIVAAKRTIERSIERFGRPSACWR